MAEESQSVYKDDRGRTCVGAGCFKIILDEDSDDIGIELDEERCSDEERAAVRKVKERVVGGALTQYEFRKPPRRR